MSTLIRLNWLHTCSHSRRVCHTFLASSNSVKSFATRVPWSYTVSPWLALTSTHPRWLRMFGRCCFAPLGCPGRPWSWCLFGQCSLWIAPSQSALTHLWQNLWPAGFYPSWPDSGPFSWLLCGRWSLGFYVCVASYWSSPCRWILWCAVTCLFTFCEAVASVPFLCHCWFDYLATDGSSVTCWISGCDRSSSFEAH